MTIPKTSKSGRILHPTKTSTFGTSTQHGKPLSLVTTMDFATHLCCSYKEYCNTLPVVGAKPGSIVVVQVLDPSVSVIVTSITVTRKVQHAIWLIQFCGPEVWVNVFTSPKKGKICIISRDAEIFLTQLWATVGPICCCCTLKGQVLVFFLSFSCGKKCNIFHFCAPGMDLMPQFHWNIWPYMELGWRLPKKTFQPGFSCDWSSWTTLYTTPQFVVFPLCKSSVLLHVAKSNR
jgi:hypothetical protein